MSLVDTLYARHREDLLVFLVRRTADAEVALDLWAETFAQAVLSQRRYRGRSDAEAAGWLYGIARKLLAGYYRRGAAERRALDKLRLERPVATPEASAELLRKAGLDDLRAELLAAVARLSDDVREAVLLRVVEELPYDQVAARLHIAEPAARARVSRGLRNLADHLDRTHAAEALQP